MSNFLIQCAICAKNFSDEKQYEMHECSGAKNALEIKMEPADAEDGEEEQVEQPESQNSLQGCKVKFFENRIKRMIKPKKGKRGRKKKVKEAVAPMLIKSEKEDADFEEDLESSDIVIKSEPIEICEVVDVKEDPNMSVEEDELYGDGSDPLSTNGEDILGLQDEDYLIENFVEYDEEMGGNLEIDESLNIEESRKIASILESTAMELNSPKKVSSNVGKRIEQTDNKGFECTTCGRKYFEKSKLEEHLKVAHRNPRPYSCLICKKSFTHKNYVSLHMRVHTGEKPYQCNLCDRSYSHKTSYTIHMRIHRGERPYECSVCGKKCYDKSGLTSHMRSHTKETPYQCECCGRKFTHSKSLLVHRRNHTGEKPYVCPHCGRAFRHWHKHKIHIRLHTGERPYKCKICNKGFPRNDEVKRHMRSHIGIKSFKCSICGVYCATQASITGHINLHHVNLVTDKKYIPDKTIVEDSQSGILGKKLNYYPSAYRQVDTESFNQYPNRPNTSSCMPQTLVTTRPMTPQEKVTNKSMTYRQFLNDQEQQLLAKGLKVVVNKSNNTYGLAPISPSEKAKLSDPSSSDTEIDNKPQIVDEKPVINNVFMKVKKSAIQSNSRPTRIILPNLAPNNSPVMIGEKPSKLLLESVNQSASDSNNTNGAGSSNSQPILIQTVGSHMSISPPLVIQSTQSLAGTSSMTTTTATSKSSNNSQTSSTGNSSILQAALTGKKPSTSSSPKENIIVLNKGVSGGANTTAQQPLVVLPQAGVGVQQQLLLLPGVNGGPARLVILQTRPQASPVIKLEPSDSDNSATSADVGLNIKKEPQDPKPMVQLHTGLNVSEDQATPSEEQVLVLTPKTKKPADTANTSFAGVRVKEEPADDDDLVMMECDTDAVVDDPVSPMAANIKTEPPSDIIPKEKPTNTIKIEPKD